MNYLLIGRPNVGKSSIYNILTGSNDNIIHSEAGTTRDWHYKKLKDSTDDFIFDTPGIIIKNKSNNFFNISNIFSNLKKNIHVFLYVVDYSMFNESVDKQAINELRKFNKSIILLINKFDNYNIDPKIDFYKLGIKNFFLISCSHRYGFESLNSFLNKSKNHIIDRNYDYDFSIAIFGKPNVGKSTILNSILGYKRSKTSSLAGTTSDYVIDYFNFKKNKIKIIDTAGIVRKSKIRKKSINFLSIKKTFEKISIVDSAIVIIDSSEGIDNQDKRILDLITDKAKSIIIIFNKIDLIKNKKDFKLVTIKDIELTMRQIKNIKVLFCSAFVKKDINNILKYLSDNVFGKKYFITTSKLNTWLKNTTNVKQHPLIEKKSINFKYAVQIKDNPITIKVFCNYSNKLKNDYKRYLVNNFNKYFKIVNQNTKFVFSSVKNPYI